MKVVFHSRTGNVRRFVKKLGMPIRKLETDMVMMEPFILVTYTDRKGEVPEKVADFLRKNHHYLKGVASSGNRNFGSTFAKSADVISEQYGVPIILKFELSGTDIDISNMKGWVMNYESEYVN